MSDRQRAIAAGKEYRPVVRPWQWKTGAPKSRPLSSGHLPGAASQARAEARQKARKEAEEQQTHKNAVTKPPPLGRSRPIAPQGAPARKTQRGSINALSDAYGDSSSNPILSS
eukprot:283818_1